MKKYYLCLICFVSLISCGKTNTSSVTEESKETVSSTETKSIDKSSLEESTSEFVESSSSVETLSSEISSIVNQDKCFIVEEPKIKFDIHQTEQERYLNDDYNNVNKYAGGKEEKSYPKKLEITWDINYDNMEVDESIVDTESGFSFYLSLSPDMSDPVVYDLWFNQGVELDNLMIGTTYYYQISDNYEDFKVFSEVHSFKTKEHAPRNLRVPNVANVRDVGGWRIDENKRVKQGNIYRGGRFDNKANTEEMVITDEGRKVLFETLKLKSEIDLMWVDMNEIAASDTSRLGDMINYYQYQFNYNDESLLYGNATNIAKCFRLFANEENYPIYYHCSLGCDRTGILTYLLNGLLGVSQDDLFRDYLFSNFAVVGGKRTLDNIKDAYVSKIDSFPGNNLQEKIRYFLTNTCMLTDDELDNVVSLMTEECPLE